MKNDKKLLEQMEALLGGVQVRVDWVTQFGNQNAFTDRCLEGVIRIAGEIKQLYDENK